MNEHARGGEHLSYNNASHEKLNAQTSRDCLSCQQPLHMHIPRNRISPSTLSLGGYISEDSDSLEVSFQLRSSQSSLMFLLQIN